MVDAEAAEDLGEGAEDALLVCMVSTPCLTSLPRLVCFSPQFVCLTV